LCRDAHSRTRVSTTSTSPRWASATPADDSTRRKPTTTATASARHPTIQAMWLDAVPNSLPPSGGPSSASASATNPKLVAPSTAVVARNMVVP
jgi:hypothetical protein